MSLVVRFLGKKTFVPGLGSFNQGARVPVVYGHGVKLRRVVSGGSGEVIAGEPDQHQLEQPLSLENATLQFIKDKYTGDVERRAHELLRKHPSKFFADKSPEDFAAEEFLATENARITRDRSAEEDALAWLQNWPAMRAQEKREAALAALAEADSETVAAEAVAVAPLLKADEMSARKECGIAFQQYDEIVDWRVKGQVNAKLLEPLTELVTLAQNALSDGDWPEALRVARRLTGAMRPNHSVSGGAGFG